MTDGSGNSEGNEGGSSSILNAMQRRLGEYLKPLPKADAEEPNVPTGVGALLKAQHQQDKDRLSLYEQQRQNELAAARRLVAKATPKTPAVRATQRRPAP